MKQIITLQRKIVPELVELMEKRYCVLRTVSLIQPVGRRNLAGQLNMGERLVRTEIEFLKNQGFLESDSAGVTLTDSGEELLTQMADLIKQLHGMEAKEEFIANFLGLRQVIIVPGNIDADDSVKRELGRAASRFIRDNLKCGSVLAVTGGTTLREVAATMPNNSSPYEVTVVPARGGLGEDVEIQANSIAAMIAKKLKGSYRLLHVPDNITEEAMRLLLSDPHIKDLVEEIKSASILIHGIGNARELSESRGDSPQQVEQLVAKGAIGEAFGHYFAEDGSIVKTIHSMGIRLNDLKKIPMVIGVAGGEKKAASILAVLRNKHEHVLITDQGAADRIVKLLGGDF